MVIAIIVAAGEGRRMQNAEGKQFLLLMGRPLLAHTLQAFQDCTAIDQIIIVVKDEEISLCQDTVVTAYGLDKVLKIIAGGPERQDSVYQGLRQLPEEATAVVVHDGARPLVTGELINNSVQSLSGWDGTVAAVPVTDTLKEVEVGQRINRTLERGKVFAAQTPQVFRPEVLKSAYERAMLKGFYGTDDAALVERAGFRVRLVEGSPENIKVTTPTDLMLAEAILENRQKISS